MCQGWLEGYLLTGRHGFFSCYEAFIHIIDSMVNQHAKWLKATRADSVAQTDCIAQLFAEFAGLAAGSQRLLAPGSRLYRSPGEQEGRCSTHLPPAGREYVAFCRRSLPAQQELHQPHRCRKTTRPAVAHDRRSRVRIARPASASGNGHRTMKVIPTWSSPVAAMCPRWKRSRLSCFFARRRRTCDSHCECRRSDDSAAPIRTSARASRRRVRRASFRPEVRASLHFTDIRGASTGSLTGGTTMTTCTCADTRKKAPQRRLSTCACSTTSIASSCARCDIPRAAAGAQGRRKRAMVLRRDSAAPLVRRGKRR